MSNYQFCPFFATPLQNDPRKSVTNCYGESWDSSGQRPMSPKLENAWAFMKPDS